MNIPQNVKTHELKASILWFDDDGVLYSVPRPGAPAILSKEEVIKEIEDFKKITNDKKVCIIIESNPNSQPPSRKERDFYAEQINSITKAMAIVTTSPVSKMIANLFFGLKPPPYPAKMFSNEKEAKEWIKQYI